MDCHRREKSVVLQGASRKRRVGGKRRSSAKRTFDMSGMPRLPEHVRSLNGLVTKTPSRGTIAFSAVAARTGGPGGDCGKCRMIGRRRTACSGQSRAPLGQAQRGREHVLTAWIAASVGVRGSGRLRHGHHDSFWFAAERPVTRAFGKGGAWGNSGMRLEAVIL